MNYIENIIAMSDSTQEGFNIVTGYIVNKDNEKKYFELQHDYSVADYDYSNSDLTEDEEEELHEKILNGNYCIGNEENIYNYITSAMYTNGISNVYINEEKEIYLNGFKVRAWINTKGFIHMIKRMRIDTNIGKKLADVEFMINKKKEIKEIGYNFV